MILVADDDESVRQILDLSLRHAGFAVWLAATEDEAQRRCDEGPDLMLAAVDGPDGLSLCRRAKQANGGLAPAVLLLSAAGVEAKVRGLEAGADDFVDKPIYVQDVVARARALLQRRERERLELSARTHGQPAADGQGPADAQPQAEPLVRFVSDVGDVPLVDLLRIIDAHQKSGVAIVAAAGARGEIFFRQGNVVDAEVGRLSGRDAIYRLFCWSSGQLTVEWKSIRRKDTIEMRTRDLLMEGLRRMDDWHRLLAGVPPLSTIFEVDYRQLAERLADIPDEVNKILRLFDGVRTFLQVVDDCGLSDLDAIATIGKLARERIIRDVRSPMEDNPVPHSDMEGWLSDAAGPFRSPPPRVERELFGALPDADDGSVDGRSTAPLDPLGDGARDALDDDRRERFTDRLVVEAQAVDDHEPVTTPGILPAALGTATLTGMGVSEAGDATAPAAAAGGDGAAHLVLDTPDAVPVAVPVPVQPDGSPPPRPRRAALKPAADGAAVATVGTELRATSGEIVVPPGTVKLKSAGTPEVRLARDDAARAVVRSSQSATPPGSARALDESPPFFEGPVGVAPVSTKTETELDDDEEIATFGLRTHARPAAIIVSAAVAIAVGLLVMHGRSSSLEPSSASDRGQAAAVPQNGPGAPRSASATSATSAAAESAGGAIAARDDIDERGADPKLARVRASEAAPLLATCRAAFAEQRMKDAEAVCTAARDANAGSAEAHGLLAQVLYNRNRRREALAIAERAVKLDPSWANAYVIIGGVHQDAGETEDARRAYQRYLELDPRGQYAGDLRVIIDRLGRP